MRIGLRHGLGGDGSSSRREWRLVAAGWLLIVVARDGWSVWRQAVTH
jgi:hypothetical protein